MDIKCRFCGVLESVGHSDWCKATRAPSLAELAQAVIDEEAHCVGGDGPSSGLVDMAKAALAGNERRDNVVGQLKDHWISRELHRLIAEKDETLDAGLVVEIEWIADMQANRLKVNRGRGTELLACIIFDEDSRQLSLDDFSRRLLVPLIAHLGTSAATERDERVKHG